MTESEKDIYNTYLKVSRQSDGKPYKKRINFDSMEDETKLILTKLDRFFQQYPNVKGCDFFKAPHAAYEDSGYYPLEFYITSKAKKLYATYMKKLELESPDTLESLKKLQESLSFVYKYCVENEISIEDYKDHTPEQLPIFIEHLKSHKISFYTLHALTFQKIPVESQILNFIFGDFYITFQKTKNMFYSSKRMKEFSKQAITIIKNKQKNNKI